VEKRQLATAKGKMLFPSLHGEGARKFTELLTAMPEIILVPTSLPPSLSPANHGF
jgi:hypothetical protein